MEIPSLASSFYSSSYFIASSLTFFLFLVALLSLLRFSQNTPKPPHFPTNNNNNNNNKQPSNSCSSSSPTPNGIVDNTQVVEEHVAVAVAVAVAERQTTGASMMEQLVPEIRTHALSYLDYRSLCRLSMTNSFMRRAANDDNAWKALYHKDFTLEQDGVMPVNGWKAYYAATRAIMNVNREFFNIIRERSLPAMSRFWLNADYVKCIHASGDLFSGYTDVIQSWQLVFTWEHGFEYQLRDVRARVLTDMAWLTMVAYFDVDRAPFHITNVFEFHNGLWFMVHHHSTGIDGEVDQQVLHA